MNACPLEDNLAVAQAAIVDGIGVHFTVLLPQVWVLLCVGTMHKSDVKLWLDSTCLAQCFVEFGLFTGDRAESCVEGFKDIFLLQAD